MNISELSKFRGGVSVDTINELTSASGVTADGVLLKDAAVTATGGVTTPTISEAVSGSGVTVDGVLLRDGGLEEVVQVQFEQATGTPSTPASGESLFYVKDDGVAYLLNSDGVETPVGGGNTIDRITQNSHNFEIGNLVYLNGSTFALANASGATTAEIAGMVYRDIGTNEFELTTGGEVNGLAAAAFAEGTIPAAGTVCFLNTTSTTGAGLLTVTEPSVVGEISKPCAIVKASGATASVYFFNMRGQTVGGTNLYSTISLANNDTTTFHTIQGDAGTGGWLSGTIKIDATTDYAIPFFCFFSRQLDGTTYNVAASYGSDIPSGLSITNSGSAVRVVMPNLAGFSSASVTYCVQAAANGTTLPVSVSASSVLGSTSGVAPAAGVIGQKIAGSSIASPTSLTTTEADAGNTLSTISLTAGHWQLFYHASCDYVTGSTLGNFGTTSVFMTDNSNNRLANTSTNILAVTRVSGATNSIQSTLSSSSVVTLAGDTTYKLRGRRTDGSGTGSGSVYNSGDATSVFYAVRIG
jgi:hypothetical protein